MIISYEALIKECDRLESILDSAPTVEALRAVAHRAARLPGKRAGDIYARATRAVALMEAAGLGAAAKRGTR